MGDVPFMKRNGKVSYTLAGGSQKVIYTDCLPYEILSPNEEDENDVKDSEVEHE